MEEVGELLLRLLLLPATLADEAEGSLRGGGRDEEEELATGMSNGEGIEGALKREE